MIRELGVEDRVLVASSEDYPSIARFRRISGGRMATSACKQEIRAFVVASWAFAERLLHPVYDALQVPETYRNIRIVTPRFIRRAHRAGLDVHVWTVDDAPTMRRLLAWGVDGIMTDRPDVLADVLREQPA
jgi:glycerophosphoryl diester phosphodiesterase